MKKILLNTAWLIMERGGQILAAILVSGLLARSLGVEQFGLFQYALTLTLIFASLGLVCGEEVVLPRLINSSAEQFNKIISNAFILRLTASLISYTFLIIFSAVTSEDFANFALMATFGSSMLFREPFNITKAAFHAKSNTRPESIIGISTTALRLAIVIAIYTIGSNKPYIYGLAWLIESITAAILLCISFKKIHPEFHYNISKIIIIDLLKSGLPFMAALISMYLFIRIDRIFMAHLSTPLELGLYTAAMQICDNVSQVAPLIAVSAAPILIYAKKTSQNYKKNIIYLSCAMLSIALLTSSIISMMSSWIMNTIYGSKFTEGGRFLSFSIFVTTLAFFEAGLNTYLVKNNHGKRAIFKWTCAAMISALACYLMIPPFGSYGAIISVNLGYITAISIGLYWIYADKTS